MTKSSPELKAQSASDTALNHASFVQAQKTEGQGLDDGAQAIRVFEGKVGRKAAGRYVYMRTTTLVR